MQHPETLMKKLPLLTLCISALTATAHAQDFTAKVQQQVAAVKAEDQRGPFHPDWNSLAAYRTPTWFQDAKFGIFLHWGVYSVPAFANEWYSRNIYVPGSPANAHQVATYGPLSKFGYKDFIPMFRAEKFNANEWVDLFASAGAKYVVPVAEHCDGFAMYDSQFTMWDAAKMGPHRDVVGELATATRAHGLRFGASSHRAEHWWWYGLGRTFDSDVNDPANAGLYGPAAKMTLPGAVDDTKEPDPSHFEQWLPPDQAFVDDWLARSTEIVDKYHPDFIYFDWWIGQPQFEPALKQFAAYYYDRNAEQHAGTEEAVLTYKIEAMPANTATLDIERGKMDTLRLLPWQTDTSISIHSWGYVEHDEYRDAKSLIHQLVDIVSKNGNLLLNVGPNPTAPSPTKPPSSCKWAHGSRSTAKPSTAPAPGKSSAKDQPRQAKTPPPKTRHPGLHSRRHPLHHARWQPLRHRPRLARLRPAPHPGTRQRSSLPQRQSVLRQPARLRRAHRLHPKARRNVPHPPRAKTQRHRLRLPHPLLARLPLATAQIHAIPNVFNST